MGNEVPCTPGLCHLVRTEQNQIRDKLGEVLSRIEQLESTVRDLVSISTQNLIIKDPSK